MARDPLRVRQGRGCGRRIRPVVEALELRTVLSTLSLVGAGSAVASMPSEIQTTRGRPRGPATVDLGTVVGSRTIQGLSLAAGEEAWFRFRTASPGHAIHWVGATFATEQGDLDVELYDAKGRLVSRSAKGRNLEDATLRGLRAGTYTLRVFSPEGEAQDYYNLVFRAPQKPVAGDRLDRAVGNSTPARAFALGRLTGGTTSLGRLSKSQRDDWFRFQTAGPGGSAQVDFSHDRGDLDLELYRLVAGPAAPGQRAVNRSTHLELVARSAGLGDGERVALDPQVGVYFVRVYGYNGAFNPSYRLTVAPGRPPVALAAASASLTSTATAEAGDWFSQNLVSELEPLVSQLMTSDGQLSRSDMLTVFATVEQDGTVTADEFQDLQTIVQNTTSIVMTDAIRNLSSKVVGANLANAYYQQQPLGNLQAGSPASQLQDLVNKWFLGLDRPSSVPGDGDNHTYAYGSVPAAGSLFGTTIQYGDIQQGDAGDCYLFSSLGSLALHTPALIQDLIVANGDGTYTVRFYYDQQGVATADYVTVDGYLPIDDGYFVFANNNSKQSDPNNILWGPLVEKAYAQWSAEGHNGQLPKSTWTNSYSSIGNGGYADKTLGQLTGSFTYVDDTPTSTTLARAIASFLAGSNVVFGSNSIQDISDSQIVDGHDYAMVAYDSTTQIITLFNPWGLAGGYNGNNFAPGLLNLTQAQILANYGDVYFTDLTG